MFDVFFPQDYPNVPPLMNMATNGEGRARFNPNLYADGKVSTLILAYILVLFAALLCHCLQLVYFHYQLAPSPSNSALCRHVATLAGGGEYTLHHTQLLGMAVYTLDAENDNEIG